MKKKRERIRRRGGRHLLGEKGKGCKNRFLESKNPGLTMGRGFSIRGKGRKRGWPPGGKRCSTIKAGELEDSTSLGGGGAICEKGAYREEGKTPLQEKEKRVARGHLTDQTSVGRDRCVRKRGIRGGDLGE